MTVDRPLGQATDASPRPAAFFEAGILQLQAGGPLVGQLCCRQALAADPDHTDSLHLMGLLALQARQFDHAIAWIARANAQDVNADYLVSLGTALEQQGLHQEAYKAFDRGVQLKPGDAELWAGCGQALIRLERPAEALACQQRVLAINPRDGDAAFRCGFLLLALQRPAEALVYSDLCHELMPNRAAVLEQRGMALHRLKRFDEALVAYGRAHELQPGSADICNNIGASLQFLRRDAEALEWFDKAIALRPDFIMARINKASSLAQIRRIDEAIATYREVQAIDPGNAEAEFYLSMLHRLRGDFEAGWEGQKARWSDRTRSDAHPDFGQRLWRGEADIAGKTMLVYADEGMGDTIQHARYIPMLAARGARIVLVAEETLHPLLAGLPGVVQCLPRPASSLPPLDLHCPVCSLPMAFGTRLETIPAAPSYLPPPAAARVQRWDRLLEQHLGARKRLRVGLAWSGNPQHSNDHNRSIPLRLLQPLLDVDADVVSLQREVRPTDITALAASRIVDLGSHLTDFAETHALMHGLDLVITVDTSVAHLAAAAGRPTWILLPYFPDYRWLLDRDDSPWYPTVRLFRQSVRRDWEEVVEKVRQALEEKVASQS